MLNSLISPHNTSKDYCLQFACERSHLSMKFQQKESMPFHPCGLQQREKRKYEECPEHIVSPPYISSDAVEGKGVGKNTWRKRPRSLKVACLRSSGKEVTRPRRISFISSVRDKQGMRSVQTPLRPSDV